MKTVLRSTQFSALLGRRLPQGSTRGQRQAASRAASGRIHRHGPRSEVHSPCLASRTMETDLCLPRIQGISGRRTTSWTMVGHRRLTRTGSYRPSQMRSRVSLFSCLFYHFLPLIRSRKNKRMLFSPRYCTPKLPRQYPQRGPSHRGRVSYHQHPRGGDFSPTTLRPTPPLPRGVSTTPQMKHTP